MVAIIVRISATITQFHTGIVAHYKSKSYHKEKRVTLFENDLSMKTTTRVLSFWHVYTTLPFTSFQFNRIVLM